jgi:hypothetical protein
MRSPHQFPYFDVIRDRDIDDTRHALTVRVTTPERQSGASREAIGVLS